MANEGTQREFDFDRGEQLRILRLCKVGSPTAKLFLRTIDCHIGAKNRHWDLSFDEIAEEMNCSVSAARDQADALSDLALIDIDRADKPGEKRFRITWSNLEETIDQPVKVTSRRSRKQNVHGDTSSPVFAQCDSHSANDFSHSANDFSHSANDFSHSANDFSHSANLTTYKRQERQRTPPPTQGAKREFSSSEWEEVKIQLSLFGINCADRAIEAAQNRGMTPEEVAELLRQARETPYHDDAARPAILYRRLTDWNEFYWAPPSDEIKARRAAEAATKAAERQRTKYLADRQATAQRRRLEAEDWQQFEQLPAGDQATIRERARSRASPIVRRSETGMKFETLKEFRLWRDEMEKMRDD